MPQDSLSPVFAYHERTKHQLNRYAQSLGYMDWATQPNPFRLFDGATRFELDHPPIADRPTYDELFADEHQSSLPVNRQTISRLFYESLAISARKQAPRRTDTILDLLTLIQSMSREIESRWLEKPSEYLEPVIDTVWWGPLRDITPTLRHFRR